MEQEKRGRGRPKIDTHITEAYATSRRQAVNAVYMYEGVELISVAAAEIPDGDLSFYGARMPPLKRQAGNKASWSSLGEC